MKKLNLIIIIVAVFLSALPLNAQNYCLDFDGVDDNVRIEALGAPSTTDVTIEMWFNWQDAGADNTVDFLISHRLEVLEIHTGGALNNALRFIPRTGVYLDTPADVITKNTWHHLAFVYSSAGTAHCYIGMRILSKLLILMQPAQEAGIMMQDTVRLETAQSNSPVFTMDKDIV